MIMNYFMDINDYKTNKNLKYQCPYVLKYQFLFIIAVYLLQFVI